MGMPVSRQFYRKYPQKVAGLVAVGVERQPPPPTRPVEQHGPQQDRDDCPPMPDDLRKLLNNRTKLVALK
jgi:pimeloyl-ACP methyl ester carboxylesterase